MALCIICGKEIDKETDEHIIPFSLGNKHFIIKSICKKCNSLLGEKIDDECTNNMMAQMFRQQNGIAGHSKSVPNAFAKGKDEKGEDIRVSKEMKPTIVPRDYSDDKCIHIVTSTADEAIDIIEKKLKRKGLPPLTEEQKQKILNTKPEKYHPTISYDLSLNLHKFYLEWIKIAFETLYYQYGEEIFLEESVLQLRKILYDFIYLDKYDENLINGKVGIPINEKKMPLDKLKECLKDNVVHIIHFDCVNNELTILIMVEGMVNGAVKLKIKDSSKFSSHLYMICYPSGNIIAE